jgi:hypothetical protein
MKDSVNYAVGAAKIIRLPGDLHNTDSCDISITHRYQNRTAGVIHVSRRDGVRLKAIPASRYNTSDEFRVYVSYTASRDVIKNAAEILDESQNSSIEHDKILRALVKAYNQSNGTQITAVVEYVVPEHQFRDSGGRLYIADLDLLLEDDRVKPMAHPYSHNGIDRKKIDSLMPSCGDETLAFMFKAVDNSGYKVFSDRYINIGGLVFRIPVEQDDAYPTGVHVISRKSVEVVAEFDDTDNGLGSTFYTFEEADKRFGLHLTAEEAKVAGPITEALKDQVNLTLAKDKLTALKDERTLQVLRNQQQQQKLELEMQLNGSRSFLEYAKIGTAILTATVTVLTIWQKLATK